MASRGRPIVIEFAAKTRDFLKGTKDVERATEDIADELKDAARDADKFERDFKDAMKDAEKASDKTARNIGKDFDKVPGELGDIGQDAGDEFVSNIGEAVSSGDIGGLISGTLGGIVGGLKGPLSLAAAGLAGVAVLAFQELQKEAEKTKALVDSRLDAMRERLGMVSSEIDAAFRQEQKESWIKDNLDTLQEMRPLLQEAGINAQEYADAMFEGGQPAQDILDRLRGIRDTNKEIVRQGDRISVDYNDTGQAANDLLTATQGLVSSQKEVNDEAATFNAFVGTGREGIYSWGDAYDDIIRRMKQNPPRIEATIAWYNTGPGAAYVDPSSANYSPGHVTIQNTVNSAR